MSNDKKLVVAMNSQLTGEHGIVILTGENRPKYVGTFIEAELCLNGSLLIRFSEELVLFVTFMAVVTIVGEKKGDSYPGKEICDELYIGKSTLGEIFSEL